MANYSWPITINSGATLTFGSNMIFGDASHCFIIGSDGVIIDGAGYTVDISNVTNYPGLIRNSYSNTTVKNIGATNIANNSSLDSTVLVSAGGWIGQSYYGQASTNNIVQNCYSTGTIAIYCGGILGASAATSSGNLTVRDCYSTGIIDRQAGGIVGFNPAQGGYVSVSNCYSIGNIGNGAGGIVGYHYTDSNIFVSNCYVVGMTTQQQYSTDQYGNSIVGIFGGGSNFNILRQTNCIFERYINVWNPANAAIALNGFGSIYLNGPLDIFGQGGRYILSSAQESYINSNTNYITQNKILPLPNVPDVSINWPLNILGGSLSNPINIMFNQNLVVSDASHYLIIASHYTTIDGDGYTVDVSGVPNYPGFIQNGNYNASIFGYSNTIIQNLAVISRGSTTLKGSGGWIGQNWYGYNSSGNIIQNCYSTGVIGNGGCGGIVGQFVAVSSVNDTTNSSKLTIQNCYSTGDISGTDAGGIYGYGAGSNSPTGKSGSALAINCFSTGNLPTTGTYSGGIFGGYPGARQINSVIKAENCYVAGCPNSFLNSFDSCGNYIPGIFAYFNNGYLAQQNCKVDSSWNTTNASSILTGVGTGIWNTDVSNLPYPHYVLSSFNTPPTIELFSIPPKIYNNPSFIITNPISTNTNTFSYSSSNTTVATISGNIITIVGVGTSVITATQSANNTFGPGTTSTTFTVDKATPILGSFSIPAKQYSDPSFIITDPSSNSAGAFTYTSDSPSVATVSGRTFTIVGQGTSIITATQDACGNFNSASTTSTLTVNPLSQITSNKTLTNLLASNTSWPLSISGGILGTPVVLTLGDNLTFTDNSYCFNIGSPYAIIDGSGYKIDISGVSNYSGLVNNPNNSNVILQNLSVTSTGGTSLANGAGWIGQAGYGAGATGLQCNNCNSNGTIGGVGSGGIFGQNLAHGTSSMSISRCYSSGVMSGQQSGGIVGAYCQNTSITNCFSTGDITGSNVGGVLGYGSSNSGITCSLSYSLGAITGIDSRGVYAPYGN